MWQTTYHLLHHYDISCSNSVLTVQFCRGKYYWCSHINLTFPTWSLEVAGPNKCLHLSFPFFFVFNYYFKLRNFLVIFVPHCLITLIYIIISIDHILLGLYHTTDASPWHYYLRLQIILVTEMEPKIYILCEVAGALVKIHFFHIDSVIVNSSVRVGLIC